MKKIILIPIVACLGFSGAVIAQEQIQQNGQNETHRTSDIIQVVQNPEPQNRVNINAVGSQEVDQDYLTISLSYTEQGSDAKTVQKNVSEVVNAAIAKAKEKSDGDTFKVSTSNFTVYPNYNDKQKINKWSGQGTITLEGTDFATISEMSTNLDKMVVTNISLGLSPEKQKELKNETVKMAIDNFKEEAATTAEMFGFKNYKIKEVSVSYNQPNYGLFKARAMSAPVPEAAMNDMNEPLTVSPGKQQVEARVSGSIEMN